MNCRTEGSSAGRRMAKQEKWSGGNFATGCKELTGEGRREREGGGRRRSHAQYCNLILGRNGDMGLGYEGCREATSKKQQEANTRDWQVNGTPRKARSRVKEALKHLAAGDRAVAEAEREARRGP